MSTKLHRIIRKRLHERAGLPPCDGRSLDDLRRSEWSPEFERLMRNRLVMGAMRYGLLNDPDKEPWNRAAGIWKRLNEYRATGNTECLVDIANLALLEFEEGQHPQKHFAAAGDGNHSCM